MANDNQHGATSGGNDYGGVSGGVNDWGGVGGSVNTGPGTQNIYYGSPPGVGTEATRRVAQHQPEGERPPVGRASELQAVQAALDRQPCLAIVGVGGIGKSTLADMHARAANYTARCWRNLHHNPNFADFMQAALASLGIAFKPAEMPLPAEQAEYLVGILRDHPDHHLLLVLNNFESVMTEASPELGWAELLELAGRLGNSRLLLTTRHLPLVRGRKLPSFDLHGLNSADGVALLEQQNVAGETADLQEAVRRAGGHPLALVFLSELADEGYHVADLLHEPIWDERIAERLLDRIYQSLPAAQQQTLQYFSLFEQPTRPEVVAGTLAHLPSPPGGWDKDAVRHHAEALAARSLLDSRAGRYSAHPIVRDYAHKRLADPAAHHRAAAAYCQSRYTRDAHTNPPRTVAEVQPLLDAFDQLYAAGDFADADTVMKGTPLEYMSGGGWISLNSLLDRWGEFSRLVTLLERVVNAPPSTLLDGSRAGAMGNLGNAYDALGDYPKAIEYHNRSLAIKEQIGDRQGQANSLGNLGLAYYSLGDYHKAIEYHNRHLVIAEQIGNRQGQATSLGNLGVVYLALGDYPKAIEFHNRQLAIAEQIGDRQGQANSFGNLGLAYDSLGDYDKAIEYLNRCLAIAGQIGDIAGQGNIWNNLGVVYGKLKRYREALACYLKAVAIGERILSPYVEQMKGNIADVRAAVGKRRWPALEAEAQRLAADPTWRPDD